MITIEKINEALESIATTKEDVEYRNKLLAARSYLEMNPDEDTIARQLQKTQQRLELYEVEMNEVTRIENTILRKDERQRLRKHYSPQHLYKQLRLLKFILGIKNAHNRR